MYSLTDDYLADLMVRMAHHSTAIEGNSLTHGETKSILIDNYLPRAMDMRELYEVLNYKALIPFLKKSLDDGVEISADFCKSLHKIICQNTIEGTAGIFKQVNNYVIGADWEPTPAYMVTSDLKNWFLDLQYQIMCSHNIEEIVAAICRQHIKFERIHPFSDGNGRVGRALMVYSCLEHKLPPIVIPVHQKNKYISLLNNIDEFGLTQFALELQKKEMDKIKCIRSGLENNIYVSDEYIAFMKKSDVIDAKDFASAVFMEECGISVLDRMKQQAKQVLKLNKSDSVIRK